MTKPEQQLVEFIHELRWGDLPDEERTVTKTTVSTVLGTTVAGAEEDGILALRGWLRRRGGAPEATVLIHGDRLPAGAAAQLNATMARALDYCDAMVPGLHLGSSLIPVALAAAELRDGVSGADFLASIAAGIEVGARLNLTDKQYDGFDPTGVAGPLAAAATASRVLGLSHKETTDALGLAFNRTGASFQSNIDGSLAVRIIQGWVAEVGITSAEMAQYGLTGPENFLGGVYGYAHLYGRDELTAADITRDLGSKWLLSGNAFKKYPSCGLTQAVTELALRAHADGVRLDTAEEIQVHLPPYAYRLVGHDFDPGENPRVDAQFSAQYCVANALLNGSSLLVHFSPEAITAPHLKVLAHRVTVISDVRLEERGHLAADLRIRSVDGTERSYTTNASRYPSATENEERLRDCLSAGARPLDARAQDELIATLAGLEHAETIETVIGQLSRSVALT